MQGLKIFGILLMIFALVGLGVALDRQFNGQLETPVRDIVRYVAPVFGLGAIMVGLERLTAKMEARKPKKDEKKMKK